MSNKNLESIKLKQDAVAKAKIKLAMFDTFEKSGNKRHWLGLSKIRIATSTFVALVLAGALVFMNVQRTPLTSQKVLANAISAIDESRSAGDWHYVKTKNYQTLNGKYFESFNELWMNSKQAGDASGTAYDMYSKTTLLDGRIFDEYVTLNGVSYIRDTRDVQKEIYGYDVYSSSSSLLPPGFEEAGLTIDAFEKMSMKEIDDALVAADQKPFNSTNYYSTDFPAYTMKPDQLKKLMSEEGIDQEARYNELFGGSQNSIYTTEDPQNVVTTPDGKTLTGEEAENYIAEQQRSFEAVEKVRNGTPEDKRRALEDLSKTGDVTIEQDVDWEGKRTIKMDLSSAMFSGGSRNYLYLEARTFKIYGEEFEYSGLHTKDTFSMKVVYIEDYYSENKPTFSTEGLVKADDFFAEVNSSSNKSQ